MGTLSYPELEATIRLLLKKYHAEYALLFGSYARGEATPNSDIDLVVVGGPGFRARDIFALGEELRQLTRKDADLILVMRDGDIVEQGTHDQLLDAGGFYADLYNSQFEDVVE